MRVNICAVGKLRKGPEKDLIDDYLTRFDRTGRAHGLGPAKIIEVEDKKGGGKPAEAALLQKAIPDGSVIVALDERGSVITSPEFSEKLRHWENMNTADITFLIGGADGIDPSLVAQAHFKLSFGKMVWPHMLVRVMLSEQLYRAASILARSPYHRV